MISNINFECFVCLALIQQLKEKDDMIVKLNEIRNSLESEIQELSASLFEVIS